MNNDFLDELLDGPVAVQAPAALAAAARSVAAPSFDPIDFQQIVEQADVGICITQDDHFQYVNPKFAQIHAYDAGELVGRHYTCVVHPDENERVAEIRRLRGTGDHRSAYQSRNVRRDGRSFSIRVYGRTIVYRGREAHLVTLSDITELTDAHRLANWRARILVSNEMLCRSGSVEVMLHRGRAVLSTGARALVQWDDGARISRLSKVLRRIHPDDRQAMLAQWRQAMPDRPFEFQIRLVRQDGGTLSVLHRGVIEMAEGRPRPIAVLQDITEHNAAREEIRRLVNYHPVTGLATRARLLDCAATALEHVRVEGGAVAMLYLRVPDLDRVYDALGLKAADGLAAALADRLSTRCRPQDTVAYLARGEFGVLLDPTAGADESQALAMATRLLAALAVPVIVEGNELFVGGHVGIAMCPGDADDAAGLLEHAHSACLRGDGPINFFTRRVGEDAVRRFRLGSALRHAIERNALHLHYQPQVDLRNGAIVGVEALLRWTSDEFGPISPAEFVPIAEEIGLIHAIGEWVFRTACEQSVEWARAGLPPVRIGVNLSPRQLERPDISQRLQSILLSTGADPGHLGIEVTESLLMRDLDHARRMLNELSAIGIEISLDDFGIGYSNLSTLRALPFDVLKIDRSLVHDVTAAPEDVSVTRAVLMLAQGLKIKVLAEGVETEGQLNLLISNGCELMQGYIFNAPVPAAQIEAMLREGRRLPAQFLARQTRQRTLLLVDDEENVLSSLRRLLRGAGYHIVIARSGPEGLAKLAEHDVDVIVSDQRMPGMTGVEFLRRAKELYPNTVRIVLSGYTELQSITDAINEGAIYKFLTKPWDDEKLRGHVAEAFRRKELLDENQRLSAEVRSANLALAFANERQELMLAQQHKRLNLQERRAFNAQDLLENLPAAMIGIDLDGLVAFVNAQARTLLDESEALVGCDAASALPPSWRDAWRTHGANLDDQGSLRTTHCRVRHLGRHYLLSCTATEDEEGVSGHVLTVVPEPAGSPGVTS